MRACKRACLDCTVLAGENNTRWFFFFSFFVTRQPTRATGGDCSNLGEKTKFLKEDIRDEEREREREREREGCKEKHKKKIRIVDTLVTLLLFYYVEMYTYFCVFLTDTHSLALFHLNGIPSQWKILSIHSIVPIESSSPRT